MLRLVLDRSPAAAVPPESMFLLDFAHVRRRGGLEHPENAARFVADVWRHPRVRLWNLPDGPPPVPAGLDHADAYRFAVESPFRAYARAAGKERWGDKTPAYLHALEEVFAVWPDARVVVFVRDARDVTLSIKHVPFGPNNPYAAARWWARGIRAGLEAERRHREQVLRVRYEDLVAAPADHVRRVCAHVGLGYNSDMLAIECSEPERIARGQESWFSGVSSRISARGAGRWRTEMSAPDQRVVVAVAGRELRELGYESGSAAPVGALRALGYVTHDTVLRGINAFRLRVVQERGRELRYALKRKLPGASG
jgi:Sulfotransferase family